MAQAFVVYCALRQVQWNKNNNENKTKFIPMALNVLKRNVSRNEIQKYRLEKTEVGRISQYGNLQYFKQETNVKKWHANIKQCEIKKKYKS